MKQKTHEITIKLRFNRPVTKAQAQYAAWDQLSTIELYGNEDRDDPVAPYSTGKVIVRKGRIT